MSISERIQKQIVPPESVAVWWLGQNSYVLCAAGACIMLDPFFSRRDRPGGYVHDEPPLRAEDLKPDAVFCTHNHSDHTDPGFLASLGRCSPDTRFFGPPESAQAMLEAGMPADRVTALANAQTVQVGEAAVRAVLSKTPEVSDVAHYGYVLDFGFTTIYNTGDIMRGVTREPLLMEPLGEAAPDVALITTSPTEEEFPDFEEAGRLAAAIGARVAIPAHYDCFADRTFDPSAFADELRAVEEVTAVIIPYCGCYLVKAGDGSRLLNGGEG